MKILVLNCGSSSVKYALFDALTMIKEGLIERIECFDTAIKTIIAEVGEMDAVGHRVVHGGEYYHDAVIIDQNVIETIEFLIPLAPLHNPAALSGIRAVATLYPEVTQVAVFDTAFHQTLPPKAFIYPLPYDLYTKQKIRRYGFHGLSHHYALHAAATHLNQFPEELNLITFHLGNGDSVCAIQKGQSVDTSMGFTPLAGLMMGTRSGDIDPEILLYLQKNQGMSSEEVDTLLNTQSGLKGVCGVSDMRDVITLANNGDTQAQLALEMFAHRVKHYLGAYWAILGKVDAVVFTGGIGEHSALMREKILHGLESIGITLDTQRNTCEEEGTFRISAIDSRIPILVVHTNEALVIAQAVKKIL
jgi:acetate kinase